MCGTEPGYPGTAPRWPASCLLRGRRAHPAEFREQHHRQRADRAVQERGRREVRLTTLVRLAAALDAEVGGSSRIRWSEGERAGEQRPATATRRCNDLGR
jgi:hypothetical protein